MKRRRGRSRFLRARKFAWRWLGGRGRPPHRHTTDSTCGSGGLLDYPHYTRPAEFRGMKIPEVLVEREP